MVWQAFLHTLFPTFCLHCSDRLPWNQSIFCTACASLIEVADLQFRCRLCMAENAKPLCLRCRQEESFLEGAFFVFEKEGPMLSLARALQKDPPFYLIEGAAAYLAMQMSRLEGNLPDFLVPMPETALVKELTQALSRLLSIPLLDPLTLSIPHSDTPFKVKKSAAVIEHKDVLIVDLEFRQRSFWQAAAQTLSPLHPRRIQGLALIKI